MKPRPLNKKSLGREVSGRSLKAATEGAQAFSPVRIQVPGGETGLSWLPEGVCQAGQENNGGGGEGGGKAQGCTHRSTVMMGKLAGTTDAQEGQYFCMKQVIQGELEGD